jgi:hypothetical protein
MTATLTFQLPEEAQQHSDAIRGQQYREILQEIDNSCRNYLKHGHGLKSPDETLQWIRDCIYESLRDDSLD